MGLEMKYFVLKPKAKHQQDEYARASQAALMAYANAIRNEDRDLAKGLSDWAINEAHLQSIAETLR